MTIPLDPPITWGDLPFAARREPPRNGDGRRSDCPDGGVHTEHSSAIRVPGGSALGS